jgi:UDP-N-acetylmuramate dehydrogenase
VITVQRDFLLKNYNTFGISALAKSYTAAATVQQLTEALTYFTGEDVFLLGGGSNMLLTKNIDKAVVHILLKGITVTKKDSDTVYLRVMAGENWHKLVMYCVENNLGGMENMALIPGNVGAAPIQNIGAYGAELKDIFHSCEVMNLKTQETKTMSLAACDFSYRESVFKKELLGLCVITSVTFKLTDITLSKSYIPKTGYGDIKTALEDLGEATIKNVAQAVINTRNSKLPDPAILGNSGSFFKNPVVSKRVYEALLPKFPDMPHYPVNEHEVKVPAGWLIDQCGLKGYRKNDAAVHERQALVLVNHGNATGNEILQLAKYVQNTVLERYGIFIETEVNIIA